MGVLSLVESFTAAAAAAAVREPAVSTAAKVDRPRRLNDLAGGRRELVKRGIVGGLVEQFNIDQKMIANGLQRMNAAKAAAAAATAVKVAETEAIYQPIWKFHTVGIGRESSSSDTFDGSYNTDDFAEVGDTVEWEIAEEFEFGSSRETLLESPSSASSACDSFHTAPSLSRGSSTSTVVIGAQDVPAEAASRGQGDAGMPVPKWRYSYQPVCILYDLENASHNRIIYNYDGNRSSAQTKRQVYGCGAAEGEGPLLLSVEKPRDDDALCESEKLLVAERSATNRGCCGNPPLLPPQTKYVGYECDTSPTQCSDRSTKTPSVCDDEGGAVNELAKKRSGMLPPKVYLVPDSVAAWKFLLLDVHYAEDEEDVVK